MTIGFTGVLWNSLRKKCAKMEFFSGPYFPIFGLKMEITYGIFVFSPNTGEYKPD